MANAIVIPPSVAIIQGFKIIINKNQGTVLPDRTNTTALRICVRTERVLEPARRADSKTQTWFHEQVYCYHSQPWGNQ